MMKEHHYCALLSGSAVKGGTLSHGSRQEGEVCVAEPRVGQTPSGIVCKITDSSTISGWHKAGLTQRGAARPITGVITLICWAGEDSFSIFYVDIHQQQQQQQPCN